MVLLNNTRELAMAFKVEWLQRMKSDLTPTQLMFSLKQVEGSIWFCIHQFAEMQQVSRSKSRQDIQVSCWRKCIQMPTFDEDNQRRIRVLFQDLQVLEYWYSGSEEYPFTRTQWPVPSGILLTLFCSFAFLCSTPANNECAELSNKSLTWYLFFGIYLRKSVILS